MSSSEYPWTPGPWGWEVDGSLYGGWENGWRYDNVVSAAGQCEQGCDFIAVPTTRNPADRELIILAPLMADAILAWGNGRLDNAAPILKDAYTQLRGIINTHGEEA